MSSVDTDPSGTRRTYPALDGIRAIAALAVVGTHAAYWTGNYRETTVGLLLARLDFGVALFFVLSGFLITSLLLEEVRRTGRVSLPAYRLARTTAVPPVAVPETREEP